MIECLPWLLHGPGMLCRRLPGRCLNHSRLSSKNALNSIVFFSPEYNVAKQRDAAV